MLLSNKHWKPDEIVKVNIEWLSVQREVSEFITTGDQATSLWKALHDYLQYRFRRCFRYDWVIAQPEELFELEKEQINLTAVYAIQVTDNSNQAFILERYSDGTFLTKP